MYGIYCSYIDHLLPVHHLKYSCYTESQSILFFLEILFVKIQSTMTCGCRRHHIADLFMGYNFAGNLVGVAYLDRQNHV